MRRRVMAKKKESTRSSRGHAGFSVAAEFLVWRRPQRVAVVERTALRNRRSLERPAFSYRVSHMDSVCKIMIYEVPFINGYLAKKLGYQRGQLLPDRTVDPTPGSHCTGRCSGGEGCHRRTQVVKSGCQRNECLAWPEYKTQSDRRGKGRPAAVAVPSAPCCPVPPCLPLPPSLPLSPSLSLSPTSPIGG